MPISMPISILTLPLKPGTEPADVLRMVKLVIGPRMVLDGHDIEPDHRRPPFQSAQVGPARPPKNLLFPGADRKVWRWPAGESPRPDLDKNNAFPMPENAVNFTAPTPPVALEKFPTFPPEMGFRQFLPPPANLQMTGRLIIIAHFNDVISLPWPFATLY